MQPWQSGSTAKPVAKQDQVNDSILGFQQLRPVRKWYWKRKKEDKIHQCFSALSENIHDIQNLQVPYRVSLRFELNLTIGKIIKIRTQNTVLLYEIWKKEYLKKNNNLSK